MRSINLGFRMFGLSVAPRIAAPLGSPSAWRAALVVMLKESLERLGDELYIVPKISWKIIIYHFENKQGQLLYKYPQ